MPILAPIVSALLLAAALAAASAQVTAQEATDMKLENAGFVMRPANTPQQMERLRRLPPRTFIARREAGKPYYLYADPDYCKCVFLGSEIALQTYKDMVGKGQASLPTVTVPPRGGGRSPYDLEIRDMDADLDGGIQEDDILHYRFM